MSSPFDLSGRTALVTGSSRGIGKALFEFASAAVEDEADYIVLSTATKNWRAILHFYLDELDMEFWSARLFKRI